MLAEGCMRERVDSLVDVRDPDLHHDAEALNRHQAWSLLELRVPGGELRGCHLVAGCRRLAQRAVRSFQLR